MNDISALLPRAFRQLPLSDELTESWVFAAWRQAVGELLGQRTKPFRLFNSTLIVSVPSLTWKRQLHDLQDDILKKLHVSMGQKIVWSLEFRVDPDFDEAVVPTHDTPACKHVDPIPLPLETIEDPELRDTLAAAASHYFNRFR
jgi:Dna[CI] antecedent DciA-like protein